MKKEHVINWFECDFFVTYYTMYNSFLCIVECFEIRFATYFFVRKETTVTSERIAERWSYYLLCTRLFGKVSATLTFLGLNWDKNQPRWYDNTQGCSIVTNERKWRQTTTMRRDQICTSSIVSSHYISTHHSSINAMSSFWGNAKHMRANDLV